MNISSINNYVYADGGDTFAVIIILGILYWFWTLITGDSSGSGGGFSGSSFNFSGDRFQSQIKESTKKNEENIDIEIKGKIEEMNQK